MNPHRERGPVIDGYTSYPIKILRECATVEEVVAWVNEHRWHSYMHDQLHFADASGDAVVISAGPDGEVAFTRKPAGDGFLVSTNFNLADPSNGSYPCWRYSRAQGLLRRIDNEEELTAERAASVLDAVHVAHPQGWTMASLVADLPQRLVYVYYFEQYDAPIVLSVDEEIAKAHAPGPLSALFPPETVSRVNEAYRRLEQRPARCNLLAYIWLGLVALSTIALFVFVRPPRRVRTLAILVVLVLGPVGFLALLISGCGRRRSAVAGSEESDAGLPATWQRALAETAGDLPPYVVGVLAAVLAVLVVPGLGQNGTAQALTICAVPLFTGLVLYQAPLLARATRSGYLRTLVRRLPAVLVSSNLAVAGLTATMVPAIAWFANCCPLAELGLLQLWAIAGLAAIFGGLVLYGYQVWAIRHGFVAWSELLRNSGDADDDMLRASTPSWRSLWWWILISFVVLATGMVLGARGAVVAPGLR